MWGKAETNKTSNKPRNENGAVRQTGLSVRGMRKPDNNATKELSHQHHPSPGLVDHRREEGDTLRAAGTREYVCGDIRNRRGGKGGAGEG